MYDEPTKELKIKKEFKNLIRPLHRQEYLQLEENILKDGCRDPIITWNGYIVDGHNRYEICQKHGISFNTVEMGFESKEDAIAWICANQLGRRNISAETRKFLIGMQYETEKIIQGRHSYEGSTHSDADDFTEEDMQKIPYSLRSRHKTAVRIAEENNISAASVQKYAVYTRALEEIGSKEPELVPKILSGRYKISHNNIVDMSKLSDDELKQINRRLNRSKNPYFKYSKSRETINKVLTEQETPRVKQMPEYDPDAEVTELTLTMPSWISSIKRTETNSNLKGISDTARIKLIDTLNNLKETVNEMLQLIKGAK